MIHLLDALNKINLEPSAEELADMLWLFSKVSKQISSSKPHTSFKQELPDPTTLKSQQYDLETDKNTPDFSNKTNKSATTSLFPKSTSERTSTGTKGDSISIPRVRFLANSIQISRSLRPLMQRVPSRTNKIFDEIETIHQLAETEILDPILKPAPERRFNIALIVDGNSSMVIWEPMIAEFRLLLERQGAFQDIRDFTLITDSEDGSVKLYKGVKYKATSLVLTNPKELIDPSKKCLTLIISDCISLGWKNGNIIKILSVLEKTNLLAIIQVLSQRLWRGTALKQQGTPIYLQNPLPNTANCSLRITKVNPKFYEKPFKYIKIPILTFEPELIALWSKFLLGMNNIEVPGFALKLSLADKDTTPCTTITSNTLPPDFIKSEELLKRFFATASPYAQELASYFATTYLSIPIMRLLQYLMLPNSTQTHLAEVFLSGLIKQISPTKQNYNPNEIVYDFIGNTRELLLKKILPSQVERLVTSISNFIKDKPNQLLDFQAVIPNSNLKEGLAISENLQRIAVIDTIVLKKLGGNYAKLAEKLEISSKETSPIKITPTSNLFEKTNKVPLYSIEIVPINGGFYKEIQLVAEELNKVQNKFEFHSPVEPVRLLTLPFRDRYKTNEVFEILRDYRSNFLQHKPYLVAVFGGELFSDKYNNLFGSHEANEGLAAISLYNHKIYTNTYKYLCYYFIRYCLSFIKPNLLSHEETRGCFFDRKLNKFDILESINTPSLCSECLTSLTPEFDTEVFEAYKKMVEVFKTLENSRSLTNKYTNLPRRNPFFTGRENILAQINKFLSGNKRVGMTQVISGLAGIGKTQIAIEYCYRHIDDYVAILWIKSETQNDITNSYMEIAQLLSLLPIIRTEELNIEKVTNLIKDWLITNSNWLIVLDNLEDTNLVKQYLPTNHQGHIIITTRAHSLGEFASINLEKMGETIGSLFLMRRVGLLQENDPLDQVDAKSIQFANEIVKEVDGLPLALDLAASYMEETKCSLLDYLTLYKDAKNVATLRSYATNEQISLTLTFSLAFNKVREKSLVASDLLKACALLSSDLIPEELFIQSGELLGKQLSKLQNNPLELDLVLKVLLEDSLIKRDPTNKTLSIYPLLQNIILDSTDNNTIKFWLQALVKAISAILPQDPLDPTQWPNYQRILPSVLSLSKFVNKSPDMYSSIFLFEQAGRLFNDVGLYCFMQGNHDQAFKLYQQALSIRKTTLGETHYDTATVLNNIAAFYNKQENYPKALEYYQQALSIYKSSTGNNSIYTANTLNNIAAVYHNQRNYDQALEFYKEALSISQIYFGNIHPNIANILNNLGGVYSDLDNDIQSLDCYQQALSIYKSTVGENHPSTASTLNNIGLLYDKQGNYDQALDLLQQSLLIRKSLLGDKHSDVVQSLNNIADIYSSQGNYTKALDYYQQSLSIKLSVLGNDHPSTGVTLNNIGETYRNQGNYIQALNFYNRALAIKKSILGDNHPSTATTIMNIGSVYYNQGKYNEALDFYNQSLSIYKNRPNSEEAIANVLMGIGLTYFGQGHYDEALKFYNQALPMYESTVGNNHPSTATILNNIGIVYKELRNYTQALEFYFQALSIYKSILGDNHPSIAQTLNNIGNAYASQKKYSDALDYLEQALDMYKATLGINHPSVANGLNNIALVHCEEKNYKKGEDYFHQALEITEQGLGRNHPSAAQILENLGHLCQATNRQTNAVDYYDEALTFYDDFLPPNHPHIIQLLGTYSTLLLKLNRKDEANVLLNRLAALEKPPNQNGYSDQNTNIITHTFEFLTVKLDIKGNITERTKKQAKQFIEDLGNGVLLEMIEIPGGTFMMGTSASDIKKVVAEYKRYYDNEENIRKWVRWETPQHRVTILTLYIGKYQVTQAQWKAIMSDNPSYFKGNDNLPVESVSWYDAVEFCKKLSEKTKKSYRLPSEAEWEYAARVGNTTIFAFGETINTEIVNYNTTRPYREVPKREHRNKTIPVGSLGVANDFGLYDMHGNVWEWCQDLWHGNYEGAPINGSAWEISLSNNTDRVLRGGSCNVNSYDCRCAVRVNFAPDRRNCFNGFRVVMATQIRK